MGIAAPQVEYHFDFASPNAYLSHLVIPGIEQRTGVRFEYVPVLLGGLFKLTGNGPPMQTLAGIRNKPEYQRIETQRFMEAHDIKDYSANPHFPVTTLLIMRGAVHAQDTDYYDEYVKEVFRHMWSDPKKMDDAEVVREALIQSELPADEILAATQTQQVKSKLIENTTRSVDMGAFGSPTFFVDGEIYFGKDRLRDVEEAIAKAK